VPYSGITAMNKWQRVAFRKGKNLGCHPERSEGPEASDKRFLP
jgi:hypothetical protein